MYICAVTTQSVKRFVLILFLLTLLVPGRVRAQDTLRTVNNEVLVSKVLRVGDTLVRIKPLRLKTGSVSKFPRKYLTSITMKDGFCFRFGPEGELYRDGFTSVPKVRSSGGYLNAEGVVRMTLGEVESWLGERRWAMSYEPDLAWHTVGKIGVLGGIGLCILSFYNDEKEITLYKRGLYLRIMGTHIKRLPYDTDLSRIMFNGEINPYVVAGELAGIGTLCCGLASFLLSNYSLGRTVYNPERSFASLRATKWRYWTGLGIAAAGVGGIAWGACNLAANRKWDWVLYYDDKSRNKKEGDVPLAGCVAVLTGSVLANIGAAVWAHANVRLKGYRSLGQYASSSAALSSGDQGLFSVRSSRDQGLSLSLGLTRSGSYGLTIGF